jgi:hypothetical protein
MYIIKGEKIEKGEGQRTGGGMPYFDVCSGVYK